MTTPDSFDDFYATNFARICGAMTLLTHNAHSAQEITQEAFLRAYERWSRVSAGSNPEAWVYKTAFNLMRRRWTKFIRREHFPESGLVSDTLSPSSLPDEAAIDLQRALSQLPHKQCAVVVARYMLGFSVEETSATLGLSQSNVRVLAHRACVTLGLSPMIADPTDAEK